MTAADRLALVRALAAIPIAWLIAIDARAAALVLFLAAAATDAVDGWLARRGTPTARGAFLDPLADKVLVCGALVALALAGRGWPVTVVAVLVTLREALVVLLRIRAFRGGAALPADTVAKAKTTLAMLGVALVIADGRPWAVLGAGIVGVAFLLGLAAIPRYVRAASRPSCDSQRPC